MCFCVCVCLYVCVVSNQSTSKKPHYVSDLSKLIGLIVYTPSLSVMRGEGSLANNNKNMHSLCRFTGNSTKICRNRAPNEQLPIQKSGKIPALHISQKSSQPIHSANLLIGFHKRRAPINRYINQIYNKN